MSGPPLGVLQTAPVLRDLLFLAVLLPILLVWLVVNTYIYYPVCRAIAVRHWRSLRRRVRGTASETGRRSATRTARGDGTHLRLDDDALPTMGVLLPAYRESAVIEQSISSTVESDYPAEKLHLYVLIEPDDDETPVILDRLAERYDFTTIVVPAEYPDDSTKPRALNYGFEHSADEIVCVIDAEDIVDPSLFRTAASELVAGGFDYAQAKLDMVNEADGWLNTMFRADYAYWFRSVLPAFADAGYPMPLGGTSNVFRRSVLVEMHERRLAEYGDRWDDDDRAWVADHGMAGLRPWDPQNVTEDFELGLLLWRAGKPFTYLDVVTREESPLTLDGWIKQRTRWKKGKLYTYLQFRETPPAGARVRFHLFLQSMLPHTGPINIAGIVVTLMLANFAGYGPGRWVLLGEVVGLAFVLFAIWLHVSGYWHVSEQPLSVRLQRALKIALTMPAYWLLQWGADIRALYQTYVDETGDWELTEHFGRNDLAIAEDGALPLVDAAVVPDLAPSAPAGVSRTLRRSWTVALLSGVTLAAMAARLYDLTAWSLSGSELHWLDRASGPLGSLFVPAADLHPPLYALVLRGWVGLVGPGDVAVRSLSVAFSVAALLALFALGWALYDDVTALVATALFATGLVQVHFARTVGPHAMAVCLAVCSWYAFTRLERGRNGIALGYGVATVALVYTHFAGLGVLLAQWFYTSVSEGKPRPERRYTQRLLALSTALSLPWVVLVLGQLVDGAALAESLAFGWLDPLSLTQLRTTLLTLAGHPAIYPLTAGNVLTWAVASAVATLSVFAAVAAVFTVRSGDDAPFAIVDEQQAAGLATLLVVSLAVPLALSILSPSLFVPEFTFLATVPFYLLVARGLGNLEQPRLRAAILVSLVLAAAVVGAFYYEGDSEENWRGATQQVESRAGTGDLVILQPATARPGFEHYYDGPETATVTASRSGDLDSQAVERLLRQTQGHERVWLLRYRADTSGPLVRSLERSYEEATVSRYGTVELYEFGSRTGDEVSRLDGAGLAWNRSAVSSARGL